MDQRTFSRMRSEGSRFTLGVLGLRLCSPDIAQPSATVRNRSREGRMAVPLVSSAKWLLLLVLRGRRNTFTFAPFSEDELQFS